MGEVQARSQFKFGVGSAIGRSFSLWFQNFVPFAILMFVAHVPLLILWYLSSQFGSTDSDASGVDVPVLYGVTEYGPTVLALLVTGAIVFRVYGQLGEKRQGFGVCVRVGIQRLGPVLGAGILGGIAWAVPMAVATEMQPLAALAAWIPGVVFYCMFFVAVPVAVIERRGIFGALKRSMFLARGHLGSIFLLLLVIGALEGTVGLLLVFLVTESDLDFLGIPLLGWIRVGLATVFGSLTITASTVVYYDLRLVKEGVGVDELKDVFA